MKVLFFVTSLSLRSGGPSRSVPMLAKGLAEKGISITIMTFRSDDMNTQVADESLIRMKIWESKTGKDEIESFIVTERFDLIQLQSIWDIEYHYVAKIARKHNIPYIVTPRGMLEPWSLKQKSLKKKIAWLLYQKRDIDKSACIYTTAEMEAKNVIALGVNVPCSVIPNGIDTDKYPCRKDARKVKKQILFLSRIHVKKGIELLIEAWKSLHSSFPDWHIKIVGNGEDSYILELNRIISSVQLNNCIEILPPVFGEEKVELYQSSSLFVLPSYSENFGMVIAEAMSCGVPVITSLFTPWQVLNETKTGWCIPLSVDNLEKALKEAIELYPEQLFNMGQQGRLIIEDSYGYRSVAAKTAKLYDWIVQGGIMPESVR